MNTLTEKDLKYYLGTGLKVHVDEYGFELVIGLQGDELITTEDNATIDICKPLMLPLSALTEQLTDGSIPIVELLKLKHPDRPTEGRCSEIEVSTSGYPSAWYKYSANHSIMLNTFDYKNYPLWICEYLYANHFWLGDQSLFETGEIIDKRNVTIL